MSDGTKLRENEHFVLVCEAVWRTLKHWYGTVERSLDLPRQCVMLDNGQVVVDAYPISITFFIHLVNSPKGVQALDKSEIV